MHAPRIFVSSTCHDLKDIRSELREFILSMRYEPVMSDFADILYHPDEHTYKSCLGAAKASDIMILIIGSRVGGRIDKIDRVQGFFDKVVEGKSITQAETFAAREYSIPIFAFVNKYVWYDYRFYKSNEGNSEIKYPAFKNQKDVKAVFDFIKYIEELNSGNALHEFETFRDIKDILTKQWAMFFKSLLDERSSEAERVRNRDLKEIKEILISQMDTDGASAGIVNDYFEYRWLISFAYNITAESYRSALIYSNNWIDFNSALGIKEIPPPEDSKEFRPKTVFLYKDDLYFKCKVSNNYIREIKYLFDRFVEIKEDKKNEILDYFSSKEKDLGLKSYFPFVRVPADEY